MIKFIKSDVMQYFAGGFAIGAIALFAMQPDDARAEVAANIVAAASHVYTQQV